MTALTAQSNVAASAGILAGLSLKRDFINQVLRRDIMQQSVIYQEWREEFLQEGRQKGRQEGRQEGEQLLILRLLTRRLGSLSLEMRSQIQALSLDQLEALGDVLLDFTDPVELKQWLKANLTDRS